MGLVKQRGFARRVVEHIGGADVAGRARQRSRLPLAQKVALALGFRLNIQLLGRDCLQSKVVLRNLRAALDARDSQGFVRANGLPAETASGERDGGRVGCRLVFGKSEVHDLHLDIADGQFVPDVERLGVHELPRALLVGLALKLLAHLLRVRGDAGGFGAGGAGLLPRLPRAADAFDQGIGGRVGNEGRGVASAVAEIERLLRQRVHVAAGLTGVGANERDEGFEVSLLQPVPLALAFAEGGFWDADVVFLQEVEQVVVLLRVLAETTNLLGLGSRSRLWWRRLLPSDQGHIFLRDLPAFDRAIATACFWGRPSFISIDTFLLTVFCDLPFLRGIGFLGLGGFEANNRSCRFDCW